MRSMVEAFGAREENSLNRACTLCEHLLAQAGTLLHEGRSGDLCTLHGKYCKPKASPATAGEAGTVIQASPVHHGGGGPCGAWWKGRYERRRQIIVGMGIWNGGHFTR